MSEKPVRYSLSEIKAKRDINKLKPPYAIDIINIGNSAKEISTWGKILAKSLTEDRCSHIQMHGVDKIVNLTIS
jgi:hypothetical protein